MSFPWLSSYPKKVATQIDTSKYPNILSVFLDCKRKYNHNRCFTNMGVSITYNELDNYSDHFASFLQNELGLQKGDRIAIQMPNLLQFPVVLFAAFKIGLIVVNTNPLYTAPEMEHQFKDSGAKCIVILANFANLLEKVIHNTEIESVIVTEIGDLFPTVKRTVVNGVIKYVKKMVPEYKLPQAYSFRQALSLGKQRTFKVIATQANDIAFLQYTGGTTGVAKGAMLTHRNITSNMQQIFEWMKPLLDEGKEIVVTALPLYHIFSLSVNCLSFMCYGAENVLVTNPKDIPGFIKLLRSTHFTIMTGVNTLYNALMNHPEFGTIDFKKVKVSVAGAMALQQAVANRWLEKTGTKIFEGFGLTEASPVVCCNPISDNLDQVGTIGVPLPSTEVQVWDDNCNPVPQGESGEICVKGPQVMAGYWKRDDETAKVITNGWLKTGDIGIMLPDGFFKIVDRKKDMILVSGFNVYPNEIEDVIAKNPKVLEVAAVGKPDEHSGEVVKVVIVKKDESLTESEVINFAKQSLTGYKVPRIVEFRTELPKTNVGKILRRALR